MEAVEPIQFKTEGSGLDIDNEFQQRGSWDDTKLHLLDTAVGDFCDRIDDAKLFRKYQEVYESEIEPVTEILPKYNQSMQTPTGFPFTLPGTLYLHDDSFILPNRWNDGVMYIISNNKNKARNLRERVVSALEDKTKVVKGAGVDDFEVLTGKEFAKSQLESIDSVASVELGEPDEFEQEVYDALSPISESFVHNVTVDFDGVPQNREYDLLLPTTANNILHISVKDYSGVDNSPTADDLINNPRNQATLIGADMTYSIVKGVDDLSVFLKEAEIRDDIKICEKQDCGENVRKYTQDNLIIDTLMNDARGGFSISIE